MLLYSIVPSVQLQQFIRFYRIIHFDFRDSWSPEAPIKAYRPRIEQCLQFTPFDRETTEYRNRFASQQKVALFGQHTELTVRKLRGHFLNFQVVFQPGVISALIKGSAEELTNHYVNAESVLGDAVLEVNERLQACESYGEMKACVERYLVALLAGVELKPVPVNAVAHCLLNPYDTRPLEWYARECNLSYRQFDRTFKMQTGIAPKDYRSLVRLDLAYLLKNRNPEKDGLSIAMESGFYDYQHLSKNYKKYTGFSPGEFFLLEQQAPERFFGYFEK
jgi:AraC-like DNA-binding protein